MITIKFSRGFVDTSQKKTIDSRFLCAFLTGSSVYIYIDIYISELLCYTRYSTRVGTLPVE